MKAQQGRPWSLGRGLRTVGVGLAWTFALLAATVGVVCLTMADWSWFPTPFFWGGLAAVAVISTVIHGVRRPPRVVVAGRPVPPARIIALRCVLNLAGTIALGHVMVETDRHAHDLPFWLLIEAFLVPGLLIGWGVESRAVETALLTPWSRDRLRSAGRHALTLAVVPLVSAVFWVCAASMAVSVCLLPLGRLPGWAIGVLAWLAGAVFGLGMTNSFVGLPRIRSLFEAAEVNGATGERLSAMDLLVRYSVVALVVGTSLPGLQAARHHHGLPPLSPPHGLVWLPLALLLAMAVASVWTQRVRDD